MFQAHAIIRMLRVWRCRKAIINWV